MDWVGGACATMRTEHVRSCFGKRTRASWLRDISFLPNGPQRIYYHYSHGHTQATMMSVPKISASYERRGSTAQVSQRRALNQSKTLKRWWTKTPLTYSKAEDSPVNLTRGT